MVTETCSVLSTSYASWGWCQKVQVTLSGPGPSRPEKGPAQPPSYRSNRPQSLLDFAAFGDRDHQEEDWFVFGIAIFRCWRYWVDMDEVSHTTADSDVADPPVPPRERLIESARVLFCRYGINSVGSFYAIV